MGWHGEFWKEKSVILANSEHAFLANSEKTLLLLENADKQRLDACAKFASGNMMSGKTWK